MVKRYGPAVMILTTALLSLPTLAQEKPELQLGPKSEPPAMGSDYQPLMWRGKDALFALDTWRAGQCRIDAGELAHRRSQNAEIQQLAEESEVRQLRLAKQLRSLAKVRGFKVESKENAVACDQTDTLTNLSNEAFDRAYLVFLLKSDTERIARFTAESEAPPDSANFSLRKFAARTLPSLQAEANANKAVKEKMGGAGQ